jgi:hypothetical protein
MRKPLGIAMFTGLLFLCTFSIYAQSPAFCLKHVEVVTAFKENWVPGVVKNNEDRAGGTIFEISVRIKKNGGITFQQLILENQILSIEVTKDGKRNVPGPFNKGDELVLIARSDKNKSTAPPDDSAIRQLKAKNAEGALLYTIKNKQYLRPVDVIAGKRDKKLPR